MNDLFSTIRTSRGMTLIEVLVAMLILVLTLVAALRASSSATDNQIILRQRLLAEWVGRNVLAERRLTLIPWHDSGEINGEMRMNDQPFIWTQKVTFVPGGNRDFRLIEVQVFSKDKPEAILFRAIDFARRPL